MLDGGTRTYARDAFLHVLFVSYEPAAPVAFVLIPLGAGIERRLRARWAVILRRGR